MGAKFLQFLFEVQQWMQSPFNFSLKFRNGCKIPSISLRSSAMDAKSLQFFFEVQQWMKMRLVGKVEQKTNLHL
jgi:hypothetical protein